MDKMKVSTALLALILLVAGCSTQPTTNPATSSIDNENLRVAEIDLPGMFCQSCAQNSETTLRNMPGVVDANVDIRTKKGRVIYDPSAISKEQLVQEGLIQAYDGKITRDAEYDE